MSGRGRAPLTPGDAGLAGDTRPDGHERPAGDERTVAGGPTPGRHLFEVRVYYEDTDAGGVVYHARYLAFAERARTEALRDAGVAHADLGREHGLAFMVRRVALSCLAPARLDDLLVVETRVEQASAAQLGLRQVVRRGAAVLAEIEAGLVCVRQSDGRPARIPARWRAALTPGQA